VALLHTSRPSSASARLPRLLPSLADFFLLGVFAWLFLAGPFGWLGLLMDGDTGWHVRNGQYILAHHAIPHTDLFSFSRPGAPWFAWEWLSDVVFASLFAWAGLKALVIFAALTILLLTALLFVIPIRGGVHPLLAAPLTLAAVAAASVHFLVRPHLFTLIFFPLSLALVSADRARPSPALWSLVPLAALWTNLHGGVFVLPFLTGLWTAGAALEACAGKRDFGEARRAAILTGLVLAATLVNPYGWKLHAHVWSYLRSDWIRTAVQEFQAPAFRNANEQYYEALLLAGILVAGWLIRRRRFVEPLWLAGFAHLSLNGARHIPFYAVTAAWVIGPEFDALWREASRRAGPGTLIGILRQVGEDLRLSFRRVSPWLPIAVLLLLLAVPAQNWPRDFPQRAFPVAMADAHPDLLKGHRVLSSDQWGDYLIFHFYPTQRVFFDGRSDFYGEALGRDYLALMNPNYHWPELMRRYGFDVALVPVNWPLGELLKQDKQWRLAADDGHALLFLRRGAAPETEEKQGR
jgi:hypothetical protein